MSEEPSAPSAPDPTAPKKRRLGLSTQIIVGLVAGLACGLFFGEYCESLRVVGEAFIGLLQMTVLPYITVALIANIGRLSADQARSLFLKGAVVLLSLWGIVLAAVTTTAFSLGIHRFLPEAALRTVGSINEFFETSEPIADAVLITAEAGSAWTISHPEYSVVIPSDFQTTIPLVYALPRDDRDFQQFFDHWIELVRRSGTTDRLYDHWILGSKDDAPEPRWSIIRNVLGWVD